jgi:hypothetical protein
METKGSHTIIGYSDEKLRRAAIDRDCVYEQLQAFDLLLSFILLLENTIKIHPKITSMKMS